MMNYRHLTAFLPLFVFFSHCFGQIPPTGSSDFAKNTSQYRSFSGIYPHLAYYNKEGECGTGAVVPWADRLWVVTYGPHLPFGSSDKLYEISADLKSTIRPESVGGTPANRMIHRESNQLFIGPYAIDGQGKVRTIPYKLAPGRYTGLARGLTDPVNQLLIATMEEGFYTLDVHTLKTTTLYQDGNVKDNLSDENGNKPLFAKLPGAHGKGVYSGQGVMVYSNNGESGDKALKQFDVEAGVLAEWDGKDWKVIRRNQFVEVTGPGGIYGNKNPETDPIWATGWDHKSVILGLRDQGKWTFFRLPKASHSYDGAHGWNTEWPRIRDVGTPDKPDFLMTMHGMFWHFPQHFTNINTAGIRPRSAYLKVIGDFTRWKDGLVFGCDDSAQKEFLNKRITKGLLEGPGQSNSNLWFTLLDMPDKLGPNTAQGSVWLSENVSAQEVSEPFLFAGWKNRMAWIHNEGNDDVTFRFEVDKSGNNKWNLLRSIKVNAGKSLAIPFTEKDLGEWIRIRTNRNTKATVHFNYSDTSHFQKEKDAIFEGLASSGSMSYNGGLLYGLGNEKRALGIFAGKFSNGQFIENGYYELDSAMHLVKKEDVQTANRIREKFAIPGNVVTIDSASVLVTDDAGRRWRLPMGSDDFTKKTQYSALRICREVATERDLLNVHGTFYELPAENADGFAKIRPVSSHNLSIHDYASYRGMLVMTGIENQYLTSEHIITSDDGKASIWAGTIDDLWKLGKPKGEGGVWKNSLAKANIPSDPYLIGFYDKKSLQLSHKSKQAITFLLQVEPIGHGPWLTYKKFTVKPGQVYDFSFPLTFQARWVRLVAMEDCEATGWFKYE